MAPEINQRGLSVTAQVRLIHLSLVAVVARRVTMAHMLLAMATCCYDPVNTIKGNHAYPYKAHIWAYDAGDLVKVANNDAKPWDILPYDILEFDFLNIDKVISGMYDIGQIAYARLPVIHVLVLK